MFKEIIGSQSGRVIGHYVNTPGMVKQLAGQSRYGISVWIENQIQVKFVDNKIVPVHNQGESVPYWEAGQLAGGN